MNKRTDEADVGHNLVDIAREDFEKFVETTFQRVVRSYARFVVSRKYRRKSSLGKRVDPTLSRFHQGVLSLPIF